MQRRNILFAVVTAAALVLWVVAGSYLFSKNCCGPDTAALSTMTNRGSMIIEDGADFRVETPNAVLFVKNEATPVIVQEVFTSLLEAIKYLKSNPLKRVTITGLFAGDEKNGAQLGENRADSIRQLFLTSGTPAYQVKIQAGLRDDLPQDEANKIIIGAVDFQFSCLAPFEVRDDQTGFSVKANNNLAFSYDNGNLLMNPSTEMLKTLKDLAAYLTNNKHKKLVLTGYSHPEEKNITALENLAMARANRIRSLMIEVGADGRQIEIKGIEDERIAIIESEIFGKFLPNATGFTFEDLTNQYTKQLNRKIKTIEEDFKEMQVFRFKHFGKEEHKIVLDEKTKAYLNDLILYISVNKIAKVFCVGHSNSVDSEEKAYDLGSDRAHHVKDFLLAHGISKDRIELKSAGSTHPLGEETTQYGQQINRRVDLFISYDGKMPQLYALAPRNANKLPSKKENKSKTTKNNNNNSNSTSSENENKVDSIQ